MSLPPPSVSSDRRPIASREVLVFRKLASALARGGISANMISVAGVFAAAGGTLALVSTGYQEGFPRRLLFIAAAIGIQLRLLANMLDGMVALARGTASAVGELFNEIPDRVWDTLLLVGAGYAAGGVPWLGWAAACMALFVTYVRAVGKGMGVNGLFHGPMSKSHRMFLLTVGCVYAGVVPGGWMPVLRVGGEGIGVMGWVLGVVIVGGAVTAGRRVLRIVRVVT